MKEDRESARETIETQPSSNHHCRDTEQCRKGSALLRVDKELPKGTYTLVPPILTQWKIAVGTPFLKVLCTETNHLYVHAAAVVKLPPSGGRSLCSP